MKKQKFIHLLLNLFEDSQFFLQEAKTKSASSIREEQKYIRTSILIAWAGFEGWINKSAFDLAKSSKSLTPHDKGILLEKRVDLKNGTFIVSDSDKYVSTETKIEYLLAFSNYKLDKSDKYWNEFKNARQIRDSIVHPKVTKRTNFSLKDAELTIRSLTHYQSVLKKKLYK